MDEVRRILTVLKSRSTLEGAGVRLKRVFGNREVSILDPFLLLDHFGSENPDDYLAGFPWHPHRGIETITYMLKGEIKHEDSLGNAGTISSGDCQWMTAGSGIIHQEMPYRSEGMMMGFQLWANLPSSQKMMHPRYQEVTSKQVPEIKIEDKATVKIICGEVNGVAGPVKDIITDPEYLDVTVNSNSEFTHKTKKGHTVFAYVFEGKGHFDEDDSRLIESDHAVIFGDGEKIVVRAQDCHVRFLLISGKPIKEPVAWYGPIVMNTQEELQQAFDEYRKGTFIKHK